MQNSHFYDARSVIKPVLGKVGCDQTLSVCDSLLNLWSMFGLPLTSTQSFNGNGYLYRLGVLISLYMFARVSRTQASGDKVTEARTQFGVEGNEKGGLILIPLATN